ncbi:hypothetical protein BS78_06G026400 [Paspalum vaginatum]|nr:hypothetical protein BS78_06G026400 [Paspalum vaginatum]
MERTARLVRRGLRALPPPPNPRGFEGGNTARHGGDRAEGGTGSCTSGGKGAHATRAKRARANEGGRQPAPPTTGSGAPVPPRADALAQPTKSADGAPKAAANPPVPFARPAPPSRPVVRGYLLGAVRVDTIAVVLRAGVAPGVSRIIALPETLRASFSGRVACLMFIPKGPKTVMSQEFSRGISSELMTHDSLISEPCKSIWEDHPLILCDAHIIKAAEDVGIEVNASKKITDILQMHPGPVKYFRVDSSRIDYVTEKLNEWFELLRRKQVEEVVYVSCSWPFEVTEFPIDDLDCKYLRRISLCFVRISDPCLSNVDNITSINLSCCSINSEDLYALSYQCKKLKDL